MADDEDRFLRRASTAKRESRYVEFKESFDPTDAGSWCELLKDLIAIANTGGGILIFGVKDNGTLGAGAGLEAIRSLDPARISDQIFKYTASHFSDFQIHDVEREGTSLVAITVGETHSPLIFVKAGTYRHVKQPSGKEEEKIAFREGILYVRHGAKSEPATSQDLERFIERRVETLRKAWLGGIRKVMDAPHESDVLVYQTTERDDQGKPLQIRVTNDPEATLFGRVDANITHPHRQTEVIRELSRRLPKGVVATSDWVQSVRKAHGVNAKTFPEFCYQPRFSSQQYSDNFIEWMLSEYANDPMFFQKARQRAREMRTKEKAKVK